jgi:tetratricopeptide (TPR) repeat protein
MTGVDVAVTELAASADDQLRKGETVAALASYRQLVVIDADNADHWFNLGYLERAARNFDKAIFAYGEALARGIARPQEVYLNRALVWSEDLLNPAAAAADLATAVSLAPDFVTAWLNLGNLHEDAGDADSAISAYEAALQRDPLNGRALARLAAIGIHRGDTENILPRLLSAVADPRRTAADDVEIRFAIGHIMDSMGEHDLAFDAYLSANITHRETTQISYSARDEAQMVQASLSAFPTPAKAMPIPEGAPRPVFICGLFRSGSTLLEQLLGRHSALTRGGELDLLPWLVQTRLKPWPESLAGLGTDDFTDLQAAYLAGLPPALRNAALFTDKRPDNFLYIGLIKAMFPDAQIVHTVRRPIDNLLSMWFLHFGEGVPYASDFDDLLAHYWHYRTLMQHWHAHFGEDIIDVSYDSLVADPETEMRRVLRFLGLEWEADCTSPEASGNLVRTASVWQVRQPLHQRSSGRSQRYHAHIADLAAEIERIDAQFRR